MMMNTVNTEGQRPKRYSNLAPEILTVSAKAGASARKFALNWAGDLEVVTSIPWAAKRCFTPG